MIAAALLILLGCYLACGLVVAIPFALVGVGRIDPHAAHGSWGFRLLIIPGSMAFWPLLLRRWLRGVKEPPEEGNAHRLAARRSRREEAAGEISQNSQSLLTPASLALRRGGSAVTGSKV